ncbi:MAG: hypothetical protein C5B43_00135 [Verrucomicrobia bacterium]|nr:MAG: hypothetical protein C5B43_00135 [Verrucomicrobiota bacterium]
MCEKIYRSTPYVHYQNILDHLSLNLVFKYDLNQLVQTQLGHQTQKEILAKDITDSLLKNLEKLIEANDDVLRGIEQIANNEFKIETGREIRSLAEMVAFIRKLQTEEVFQKSEL